MIQEGEILEANYGKKKKNEKNQVLSLWARKTYIGYLKLATQVTL